jgi:formiminoglutamase
MSRLPLLLSVPHAGLDVPPEAAPYCVLSEEEIRKDGDEQAAEVYTPLESAVSAFQTTPVARAIVDMNRPESDRRKDGVVKTHTCWDVPVYSTFPPEDVVEALLDRYHRPYHKRLTELAATDVRLGVDCHTMAATGPPVGPDPGAARPLVCLSNAGSTCPGEWLEAMAECFRNAFGAVAAAPEITLNRPFQGGFIVRFHSREIPWVQLELSRTTAIPVAVKSRSVLEALTLWSRTLSKLS